MDIAYNKTDGVVLPITNTRISASEYNQIAASLMQIITSAGLTPDSQDNAQLLNALGPRIVETYSNGTSWYRVYSDGWCEQGGIINVNYVTNATYSVGITFTKEFADTNYSILAFSADRPNVHQSNISYPTNSKATTGFTMWTFTSGTATNNVPVSWEAKGYIA